jgi:hypothetical protein
VAIVGTGPVVAAMSRSGDPLVADGGTGRSDLLAPKLGLVGRVGRLVGGDVGELVGGLVGPPVGPEDGDWSVQWRQHVD